MKQIAIVDNENYIFQALNKYAADEEIKITQFANIEDLKGKFDLIISNGKRENLPDKTIVIHPSLLPAFDEENAIEKAYLSGVKVSGVTFYNSERIIAQYPVLIGIDTHLDELKENIINLENYFIVPIVDAFLNDRLFDFQDLYSQNCSHGNGCSGCGNCK